MCSMWAHSALPVSVVSSQWSLRFRLSLPVVYFVVALTADMPGFQLFSCSNSVLPPRKNDKHPLLKTVSWNSQRLCWSYCVHRNRKCFTDSAACLHGHDAIFVALILQRYSFSLTILVCSWANTTASEHLRLLYSSFTCFPSSALSNSIVYLPTPFSISLLFLDFCSALPRTVALELVFPISTPLSPVLSSAAFLDLVRRATSS